MSALINYRTPTNIKINGSNPIIKMLILPKLLITSQMHKHMKIHTIKIIHAIK